MRIIARCNCGKVTLSQDIVLNGNLTNNKRVH